MKNNDEITKKLPTIEKDYRGKAHYSVEIIERPDPYIC